jgi:hypothetical protein
MKGLTLIRMSLKYFGLNINSKGEIACQICDFVKFGRHVVLFIADSDLSSALIFDVIACFEGVVHIENYGFVWRFNKNIDYFSASNSLINVSLDRFKRYILQTEIFYITELLTEMNQEFPANASHGCWRS